MSEEHTSEDIHVYGHVVNATDRNEALSYIAGHRHETSKEATHRAADALLTAYKSDHGLAPPPGSYMANTLDLLYPGWNLDL